MGILTVIRDVSREVAQDQALRQVQRMEALGQLTGGIAHDFNNLLTIITGNLELLEFDLEGEEPRDLLKRAHDAANMGARLTDRLLTFARRRPLDAVLINLNDQLIGMMDLLRRSLGETVNFASSFAADLWPVRSDVSEIENAVLNLAINARDAMPAGGELLIETSNLIIRDQQMTVEASLPEGDYVRLSVSDTGHGIEPEALSRVFEPFFTTKEAGRGTGLGLSVIYGFAKQSGGGVTIYSEPGTGTTVNLYLPRAESGNARCERENGAVRAAGASGETVLVVEDQAPVRDVTLKRLTRLGYKVREAENAAAAIALLKAGERVDLIFSDVVMPGGLTGFDLADWVHANRPGLPILLTSGFSETIAQGLSADRSEVRILRKPYSGDDLAAAIRSALDDNFTN
jgi:nitrogen-specific signal transduction histidine kinase/ActR/RegA family two-component response regulator